VAPLVFKTSERRAASLAGSIPVRLRHLHGLGGSAHLRILAGCPCVPRHCRRALHLWQIDLITLQA
jgi:hypothetical protein